MPENPSISAGPPDAPDQAATGPAPVPEAAVAPPVVLTEAGRPAGSPGPRIAPHDFRTPVFLTELELRRLRARYEDFVRYLTARLSLFLRLEVGLKLSRFAAVTYGKFTAGILHPTPLCLFKVDPLRGVGVFAIDPHLALTIVDRMLGGRGQSAPVERDLTEIERVLLDDVAGIILQEWCNPWRSELELHPSLLGHENDARFLQTSSRDAVVLALQIEATVGECTASFQIGVPYYTIEPLVRRTQARRQKDPAAEVAAPRAAWQPAYDHIAVPVRAEWTVFETSLREIASFRVGDVIELSPTLVDRTRVLLNGVAKFTGKVGLDSDHVTVQITRNTPPPDHHADSIG